MCVSVEAEDRERAIQNRCTILINSDAMLHIYRSLCHIFHRDSTHHMAIKTDERMFV